MKKRLIGIGGANADFLMHASLPVVLHDSNPGHFSMAPGGVIRNICENAARLGISTSLLTAIGSDAPGKLIRDSCEQVGIDLSLSRTLTDCPSSVYLSALDEKGEMFVSFSDMAAAARLMPEDLDCRLSAFRKADVVCLDGNPSREFLVHAAKTLSTMGLPLFLDPVSTAHCKKLTGLLGCFDTVKPNQLELEALTGYRIHGEADLPAAASVLLEEGVRRVFVTLGTEGVYYRDRDGGECRFHPPVVAMQNANGAGDAFTAGLLSAYLDGLSVKETLCRAAACSTLAVTAQETVSPQMSLEQVNRIAGQMQIL